MELVSAGIENQYLSSVNWHGSLSCGSYLVHSGAFRKGAPGSGTILASNGALAEDLVGSFLNLLSLTTCVSPKVIRNAATRKERV